MPTTYIGIYDFVLDDKKTISEAIPIIGDTGAPIINLAATPPFEITANNAPPSILPFLELTDSKTSYTLLTTDYMVQVASITYTDIYLPLATGLGAYTFYISNVAPQKINVRPQGADTIDDATHLTLHEGQHAKFTSNDHTEWFVS